MSGRDCITWVHASAVAVAETGILIRGLPGVGKTTLALALLADSRRRERFARLVADDTVGLRTYGERVVACPHPRTAGSAERRGIGIVPVLHEPACVVRLVVDLVAGRSAESPRRLPEEEELRTTLLGATLPRLALLSDGSMLGNVDRVLEFSNMFRPGS